MKIASLTLKKLNSDALLGSRMKMQDVVWKIYDKCLCQNQMKWLKCGFCNNSFRKDEPLTSWTILQHMHLSSIFGVISIVFSNHPQKWGQICCKSVQLVRGSSFRNDLLQNPYFIGNSALGYFKIHRSNVSVQGECKNWKYNLVGL